MLGLSPSEVEEMVGKEQAHIQELGHKAIYSSHLCPECKISWRCQSRCCRRPVETYCSHCEIISFPHDVQDLSKRLLDFFNTKTTPGQWYEAVKHELAQDVKALVERANHIADADDEMPECELQIDEGVHCPKPANRIVREPWTPKAFQVYCCEEHAQELIASGYSKEV